MTEYQKDRRKSSGYGNKVITDYYEKGTVSEGKFESGETPVLMMISVSRSSTVLVDSTASHKVLLLRDRAWKATIKYLLPHPSIDSFPKDQCHHDSENTKAYRNRRKHAIPEASQITLDDVINHPSHEENRSPEAYDDRASNRCSNESDVENFVPVFDDEGHVLISHREGSDGKVLHGEEPANAQCPAA